MPACLPGCRPTPVYDRTALVDRTIATVSKNLVEGALLVIVVLFLLLGNFRAALITAAVIPLAMLFTVIGMVRGGVSGNLMSLGALDFGLIVDGAVIIIENCLRRFGEMQHQLGRVMTEDERLDVTASATAEVIRPSLFGLGIIARGLPADLRAHRHRGKDVPPDGHHRGAGADRRHAAVADLRAGGDRGVPGRPRGGEGKPGDAMGAASLRAAAGMVAAPRDRWVVGGARCWWSLCGLLATRLGTEFIPNLDEGDIALHALRIPGTSLDQAVKMQSTLEARIKQFPEVERVFGKLGTAEVATDPMPPSVADTFLMMKPRAQWPDPRKPRDQLVAEIEAAVKQLPGNNYEFTQPIQMRMNELISGVRADVAIKLYGDDLDTLVEVGKRIEAVAKSVPGAADVKLEQATGLPLLTITPDREALVRYGLNPGVVQETVATAVGGEVAGQLFEGDRRFDIVVRLPKHLRQDPAALADLPIPLGGSEQRRRVQSRRHGSARARRARCRLREVATIETLQGPNQINRENGKRRVVVTANVRGRDLGGFVSELQQRVDAEVEVPAGYWIDYGGTFEQLISASQRLSVVVPVTLVIIFAPAVHGLRFGEGCGHRVQRRAAGADRRRDRAVAARYSAVDLGRRRLHRAVGRGGAQRPGDDRLHPQAARSRAIALDDAIVDGALGRLRPVLMTALVASLGFVPMAFNVGAGSEVQRPLATVVIGGIVSSTLLTLLVLPALYRWFHGVRRVSERSH